MIGVLALMAYINPGTGSLFLQVLLIGVAGAWVTFRSWGRWIKDRVRPKPSAKPSQEPDGR